MIKAMAFPLHGLSKPAKRASIHTRAYEANAYEREDGLIDVEVQMTDTKPFWFDNQDRDGIAAGEPLHHMVMRITIDEDMKIHGVEAATLSGPYSLCGDITKNYERLIGLSIVSGFNKRAGAEIGGNQGCTHHTDMLRVMANTAFQAIYPIKRRRFLESQAAGEVDGVKMRNKMGQALLNTCHAYAPSSPVVERQYPDFYQPQDA